MSICRADFSAEQAGAIDSMAKRLHITFAAAVRVILDRHLDGSETVAKHEQNEPITLAKREQNGSETVAEGGRGVVLVSVEEEEQQGRTAKKRASRSNTIPDPPGFPEFWSEYPKKVGKGAAREIFRRTAKIRPPLPELLASLRRQKVSEAWSKEGGIYIPDPERWLKKERWADELEPTNGNGAPRQQRRLDLDQLKARATEVLWDSSLPIARRDEANDVIADAKTHEAIQAMLETVGLPKLRETEW
jgi:hypothetical protein